MKMNQLQIDKGGKCGEKKKKPTATTAPLFSLCFRHLQQHLAAPRQRHPAIDRPVFLCGTLHLLRVSSVRKSKFKKK